MLLLALNLASGVQAQGTSKATTTPALPERSADVAPFLAKMNDQQARALLAQVLEEGTLAARREPSTNMLVAFEHATAQIARASLRSRPGSPKSVRSVTVLAMAEGGGNDPSAPWRVLAAASFTIAFGWIAQATAAWALGPPIRRWKALSRGAAGAAVMSVRWLVFLAAVAATYVLMPEIARASRLTALAIILTFGGTWIVSRATAVVMLALHRWDDAIAKAGLRVHRLDVALGIFFAGLFGVALLREAGVPADARVLIGLIPWLASGVLLSWRFLASARLSQQTPPLRTQVWNHWRGS